MKPGLTTVAVVAVMVGMSWLWQGNANADVSTQLRSQYADENIRLQLHFDEVIAELNARDTSNLTADQQKNRDAAINRLRMYQVRALFPKNKDFTSYTPYFIDAVGTRCAMAYLIEEAGDVELVAKVATTANNALVRDLARDPALVKWLTANGLSEAEAGRIQPTYDPPDCDPGCRDDEQCVRHGQGTTCSKKCDDQVADSCGTESSCEYQLAGPVCYPPIQAEGERPDNSCAIAGGGLGLGALLLLGAIFFAVRRRN